MIPGLAPPDPSPYSSISESNVNVGPLAQESNCLGSGAPWRHHYPSPYVYDAATAVALVGYGSYGGGYSSHMDLAGRRKNATRETTATLKAWLYEHRKNPYPTKSEKVYLAIMTKMTLTQVSTWFANARRRLKKENKMTWSPRNRTNDDDDDHHVDAGSNSDQSNDDDCPPPAPPPPAQITNNNHYLSPPVRILQHHHLKVEPPSSEYARTHHQDEINGRKRKFDQIDSNESQTSVPRKSPAIWSLAEMASKTDSKKTTRIFSTFRYPLHPHVLFSQQQQQQNTPLKSPSSPSSASSASSSVTCSSSPGRKKIFVHRKS